MQLLPLAYHELPRNEETDRKNAELTCVDRN